jgi:DDE superfamily endonuclease
MKADLTRMISKWEQSGQGEGGIAPPPPPPRRKPFTNQFDTDANVTTVGPAKFYCGRKHKFGLNCQAICDARGRFLDISVIAPGATSDVLAFEGAKIYKLLQAGILAPGT